MKIQALLILLLPVLVACQRQIQQSPTDNSINAETDKIYDQLVKLRRDFHAHPELAGHETRTQEVIKQHLLKLGLEVKTGTYGHSVIGVLKGGKPGKHIAWRAEMDALPHDFADEVAFKSQVKGVQHGCGHDVHLAIALGMAEILVKHRDALQGTAYFIFQPEEETFLGAKRMLDNGLLATSKLDEVYAVHVTSMPVGQILLKPNEVFAYQKRFRVKLKNGLSATAVKELATNMQTLLYRSDKKARPAEIQLMADPQIGLLHPQTIFKDYRFMDQNFNSYTKNGELFLEAYIYETDAAKLKEIIPAIKWLIAEQYEDQLLSVSFIQENPTVLNDGKLTRAAMKSLAKTNSTGLLMKDYGQVPYFNDDFAHYQQQVPGVYFLLGGSNAAKGIVAMNHAPNFRVDETCIKIGVSTFSALLLDRLQQKH